MTYAYQSGFSQTFFASATSLQNYDSTPMQANIPSVETMPFENSTAMQQASSPEEMMCGMKNMLQGVFAQFQQTAATFQQFLSGNPSIFCNSKASQETQNNNQSDLFKTYEKLMETEPDSPKAQQYQAKIARILGNDANKYFQDVSRSSNAKFADKFEKELAQMEPDSIEARQIKAKLSYVIPESQGIREQLTSSETEIYDNRQMLLAKFSVSEPDSPEGRKLAKQINNINNKLGFEGLDVS